MLTLTCKRTLKCNLLQFKSKETYFFSAQKRPHKKRNHIYKDNSVEKLFKNIGDVVFAL